MTQTRIHTQMKLLLGLWLLLAAFLLLSRSLLHISDGWVSFWTFILSTPIAALLFWRRRVRRGALLKLYLDSRSDWIRRLRGGILMLLSRAVLAYALSLLLLIGLMRANQITFWMLLVILVPVWVFSYDWFFSHVARHVNLRFQRLVTNRLHGSAHAFFLILALATWNLYQPVPDLTGISFGDAVSRSASAPDMESDTLYAGLILTEAFSAIPVWLAQNYGLLLPGSMWKLTLWTLVLLREWLFVWPILLIFQALHTFLNGNFKDRLGEAKSDGAPSTNKC